MPEPLPDPGYSHVRPQFSMTVADLIGRKATTPSAIERRRSRDPVTCGVLRSQMSEFSGGRATKESRSRPLRDRRSPRRQAAKERDEIPPLIGE
ncbi:MAG: hypothetical protein WKF57_13770 [Nakamurella sp.]